MAGNSIIKDYLDDLLEICIQEFGLCRDEVLSKSRKSEIVCCRKAYSFMCVELFGISYKMIANRLNISKADVSYYIINQPIERYYKICLEQIRKKTVSFKEM